MEHVTLGAQGMALNGRDMEYRAVQSLPDGTERLSVAVEGKGESSIVINVIGSALEVMP